MAQRSRDRRIPVVLVSGFLGAGKTTLLNHLLRHNRGIRIGVVVNDFGSINIDSMMVAGQVDSMVSLGNGCLCCAVDVADLDAMFDTLSRSSAQIDVIVVEASGVAEPRNLVRMVRGSDNPRIMYGGLIGVIDAVEFFATRETHPEIDQHVALADLVVVNKMDLGDSDAVTAHIRSIAPNVAVLPTAYGQVDADLLFDVPERADNVDEARQLSLDELLYAPDDHAKHLHARYSTTSFVSDEPFDPRRFVDMLENPSGDVYRIKGFVHFGIDGHDVKYVVNTVGRHLRLEPSKWDDAEPRSTRIVLIGTDIDDEFLEVRLLDCIRRTGDRVDESAMMPVHRYAPQR
ncbi:MAG: GTP-binding protein [Rhodococcus sp. (in: high G+C Gram-positive bacteria)]